MLERCFHHSQREASARCPSCRMYFCRECVTEHGGRVLCERCLRAETKPEAAETGGAIRAVFRGTARGVAWLCALALVWGVFWGLGRTVLFAVSTWHTDSKWGAARSPGE